MAAAAAPAIAAAAQGGSAAAAGMGAGAGSAAIGASQGARAAGMAAAQPAAGGMAQGIPGMSGAPGAAGIGGAQGAAGLQGAMGPAGATGATGPAGQSATVASAQAAAEGAAAAAKGAHGAAAAAQQGAQGAAGAAQAAQQGAQGAAGSTGASGAQGAQGPSQWIGDAAQQAGGAAGGMGGGSPPQQPPGSVGGPPPPQDPGGPGMGQGGTNPLATIQSIAFQANANVKNAFQPGNDLSGVFRKLTDTGNDQIDAWKNLAFDIAGMPKLIRDFGDSLLRARENLAEINGTLASSFAVLKAQRFGRDVKLAGMVQGSTAQLAETQSRLEDKLLPYQAASINVLNKLVAVTEHGFSNLLMAVELMTPMGKWIVDWLATRDKGGEQHLVALTREIANGNIFKPRRPPKPEPKPEEM